MDTTHTKRTTATPFIIKRKTGITERRWVFDRQTQKPIGWITAYGDHRWAAHDIDGDPVFPEFHSGRHFGRASSAASAIYHGRKS